MIDDRREVFGVPFARRHEGDDAADLAHHAWLRGDGVNSTFPFVRSAASLQAWSELGIEGLRITVAAVIEHERCVWTLLDELHAILQFSRPHGEFKIESVLTQRLHTTNEIFAQTKTRRRRVDMQHLTQAFDDTVARVALHIFLEFSRCRPPADGRGDGRCMASSTLGNDAVRFLDVITLSYINLHVDRLHIEACSGLYKVRCDKIMSQHLRRSFDPWRADDVAIPEMLVGVDDQRIWGAEGGARGERGTGAGLEKVTAIHGGVQIKRKDPSRHARGCR